MAKVLAVVDDLFFGSRIAETARQVGVELELQRAANFRPSALGNSQPALVIFDLNATSANPVELVRQLKADRTLARVPVVAFLSHVQVELQQAAEQAGCDQVLPRSKFSAALPELLRRYAKSNS